MATQTFDLWSLVLDYPHVDPNDLADAVCQQASAFDVFLSKLFSVRDKDRDDLRVLVPQLDKDVLVRKFRELAGDFLAAPRLKEIATDN